MCTHATTRPRSATYMTIAGASIVCVSVGTLAAVSRWIPFEYIVLATAPAGLIVGSMFILGSYLTFHAATLEDEVHTISEQVTGQLAEDHEKVSRIQRRF